MPEEHTADLMCPLIRAPCKRQLCAWYNTPTNRCAVVLLPTHADILRLTNAVDDVVMQLADTGTSLERALHAIDLEVGKHG